jgi:UDP-N-acetylglucosamine 2-epimerase (non-hydrolysing)
MIHVIIGTKAQLIKMAPVMKLLKDEGVDYNYISTGQHRETMDDILSNFEIKQPDYRLYSGRDVTSVFQMFFWGVKNIVHTLRRKREIFRDDDNGIVLVHGDTFSTLLGAIMGRIAGFGVAHVESGLRSFNIFHPFPEELTRILTFRLSNYLFAPGDWACANLENYSGKTINTRYNTLLDSLGLALPAIRRITDIDVPDRPFGVVTLHRFENIFSKTAIERITGIIEKISTKKHLVFILHKPTEIKLRKFGCFDRLANNRHVELRKRLDYFRFIRLLLEADFVISDGGSNQEECYYLGKPVLLLRKATERQEGLDRNCVLSGYDDTIINDFVDSTDAYRHAMIRPETSPARIIIEHCRPYA